MATIKTTCPDCGDIKLTPEDMLLYLPTRRSRVGHYEIICNLCSKETKRPANESVVSVLKSVKVDVVYESDGEVFSEEYIAKELNSFASELEINSRLTEVLEQEQEDEENSS